MGHTIAQAKPTETFRAFVGFAAWASRQLEAKMFVDGWGILQADSVGIFEKDPATLWQNCLSRLQGPRMDWVAWVVPFAHGTPTMKWWSLDARSGDHTSCLS
ncbi:MAG: YqgE/AlgH family protein [Nitrospirae bacterium]|nr:YqgE/AlgH family protein [Nitrospirota bacterium]